MATKVARKSLSKHVLLVDTNVLFTKSESQFVSSEFIEFWESHLSKVKIELLLPSVVRGELLFHKTADALSELKSIDTGLSKIQRLTDSKYSHTSQDALIKKASEKKLDKELGKFRTKILPVPTKRMNWEDVIDSSIWRIPPFSPNRNRNTEKGFRDKLIMETIVDYVEKSKSQQPIIFATADGLLFETVKLKLEDCSYFLAFKSLEEVDSHLRLETEQVTKDFATLVTRRATKRFFDQSNHSSLLLREKIIDQIRSKYRSEFEVNKFDLQEMLKDAMSKESTPKWTPDTNERVLVSSPQFDKRVGEHDFFWRSTITFIQMYSKDSGDQGSENRLHKLMGLLNRNLLVLRVTVVWKARIKADMRFYKMELCELILDERTFEPPTTEQSETYKLS